MDKNQWRTYVDDSNNLGANEARELELLTSRYPWFHAGHILLAKTHKNQNRFSYKNLLKKASLFGGDRSLLYEFMHEKTERDSSSESPKHSNSLDTIDEKIVPVVETKVLEELQVSEVEQTEQNVNIDSVLPKEELEKETGEERIIQLSDALSIKEVIVPNRIVEIEREESSSDVEEEGIIPIKTVESISDDANEEVVLIEQEETEPGVFFDSIETDTSSAIEQVELYDPISALKNLIPEEEKGVLGKDKVKKGTIIPETTIYDPEKELAKLVDDSPESDVGEAAFDENDSHNFSDWLSHLEEADEPEVKKTKVKTPAKNSDPAVVIDLLDKFIQSKPSIKRSRKEFFDPEVQGKRSVEDDSDIVSETLAELFLKQGLTAKAIEVYEKLGLQNPKKGAYFARLIKKIRTDQNLD